MDPRAAPLCVAVKDTPGKLLPMAGSFCTFLLLVQTPFESQSLYIYYVLSTQE